MHIRSPRFIIIIATLLLAPASLATGIYGSSTDGDQAQSTPKRHKASRDQRYEPEGGAVSTSPLALPFKRAWQYLTDGMTSLAPTTDSQRLYLALSGGRIDCLDRLSGSLLWSSEPGGTITVPLALSERALYVATRKLGVDGAEAGGSLRAVDCVTGLTLWVRDYARPFTSPLSVVGDRIYAGNADGAFYSLAGRDGAILWKLQTQGPVQGEALITKDLVLFGGDDGALRGVAALDGKEVWKFQSRGRILSRPASDQQMIYFGSGDGFVYAVDISSGRLHWRARVGAAVEASIVLLPDRVIVGSLDNFVYALSRANGDRLWKRRLDSRIASAPIVEGDALLVAPIRSRRIAVFLALDGRAVNFYELDSELELVSSPLFSQDLLFLPTNTGIVALKPTPSSERNARH